MRRQAVRILKLAHEEVDLPGPDIHEQPVMPGHPGSGPKYAASAIDRQAVREFGRWATAELRRATPPKWLKAATGQPFCSITLVIRPPNLQNAGDPLGRRHATSGSAAPCGTIGQENAWLLVPVMVPMTLDQESRG
jgi:hypothetical protein